MPETGREGPERHERLSGGGGTARRGTGRGRMRRAHGPAWLPVAARPLAVLAGLAIAVSLVTARARAASASARTPGQQAGDVSAADVQRTYQADCGVCHGSDGRGTANGPPVAGVGRASVDYYLSTGRMPLESQVGRDPVTRSQHPQPGVQLQDPTATPHRHA